VLPGAERPGARASSEAFPSSGARISSGAVQPPGPGAAAAGLGGFAHGRTTEASGSVRVAGPGGTAATVAGVPVPSAAGAPTAAPPAGRPDGATAPHASRALRGEGPADPPAASIAGTGAEGSAGTLARPAAPSAAGTATAARGTAPAQRRRRVHDRTGHRNDVVLAGRVTAEPAVRELPSGDHLVTWRISITRPPDEQRPNQPADPITCVSFRPAIEAATRGWRIGDVVAVRGSLRRRFWRTPGGSSSVIEVEARAVEHVERAADPE
jgi:hypothetical protein